MTALDAVADYLKDRGQDGLAEAAEAAKWEIIKLRSALRAERQARIMERLLADPGWRGLMESMAGRYGAFVADSDASGWSAYTGRTGDAS